APLWRATRAANSGTVKRRAGCQESRNGPENMDESQYSARREHVAGRRRRPAPTVLAAREKMRPQTNLRYPKRPAAANIHNGLSRVQYAMAAVPSVIAKATMLTSAARAITNAPAPNNPTETGTSPACTTMRHRASLYLSKVRLT